MEATDVIVEFSPEERRRAAAIFSEFTSEERQRATELWAAITDLDIRQASVAARLESARASHRRTGRVKSLEREARSIVAQTESVLAEVTAILGHGIERARTREEVAV